MRTVDRFAGIPLCWVTGLWDLFFRKQPPHVQPKVILVIKFFGMGSILLSTPFLASLRASLPGVKIIFLTFENNKELLERLSGPDLRLTISTSSLMRFVSDTMQVLVTLRRLRIDTVFDLEFFSKFSTLISTCSGARTRIGYALPTYWRKSNLTHPVKLDTTNHVTKAFTSQLMALGIPQTDHLPILNLQPTPEEIASMERKLKLGSKGVEAVIVNINAGTTSLDRRWMPERFMGVVDQMVKANPSRRFYFIGSEDERTYVSTSLTMSPTLADCTVNCAGELTLGELIALLKRATILLTNDSGPMHIASATGTPTVALFGPESPRFYGPGSSVRVIYKAISCSPCLNVYDAKLFVCPYNARCMREIFVEEVVAAVDDVLAIATAER